MLEAGNAHSEPSPMANRYVETVVGRNSLLCGRRATTSACRVPAFRNERQLIRENREAAKSAPEGNRAPSRGIGVIRAQRANRFSTFPAMKTFGISSPIATKNFVNRFGASSEQFD
jgi:hypothetical protein